MSARTDPPVKSVEARTPRRKPESLAKIKKAARKLFVERGYHATRPQDIARIIAAVAEIAEHPSHAQNLLRCGRTA